MSEMPALIVALLAGFLLGTIFFGGLWWTIRRGLSTKMPAVWFSGSLLLRTTIAVAGFYFVSHGDWRRLVGCLLGFLFARMFVTRITVTQPTRAPIEKKNRMIEQGAP
jgi:F1F0 ATPase subunit 2